MITPNAVIMIVSAALVLSGITLFFGGLVSNNSGEAKTNGVYVSFSPQTLLLLALGVGLYLIPKASYLPFSDLNQLPATAAGIQTSQSYSGSTIPPADPMEVWLMGASGAFRLELFSLGERQYNLVGSMDLYPLEEHRYQLFLDVHPQGSSAIDDSLIGNGELFLDQGQWYLIFQQGSPAIEVTDTAIPVLMRRDGDFLVMQYQDSSGRTFRQTWRQI